MFKKLARKLLSPLGLNIRFSLVPGFSIFGFNIHSDTRKGKPKFRAEYAFDYCANLDIKNVLDVGSGGGEHSKKCAHSNFDGTCIDYGTSVYSKQSKLIDKKIKVIHGNFNNFVHDSQFDLVWASHVIEHQQDVGLFIRKLIECCMPNGYICITVPDPHRHLWGGHLTIWSPGLLAYNIALCGVNLSDALFIRGTQESSIIFQLKKAFLPGDLTYDLGDIDKISHLLPSSLSEGDDPWKVEYI